MKAKRKLKRLFSFLLALLLVVGMLPATAYASNEGELEGTTGQMEDTTENETSVTETTEELTVEEELLSITAMELSCPDYVAGGSIADEYIYRL